MENIDYLDWLVEKGVLRVHHEAMERGYFWRTIPPKVEPYHGLYGHGYKVHSATRRTNFYHPITYYIWTDSEYEAYRNFVEHGMQGVE